jgi:hypothetical protein
MILPDWPAAMSREMALAYTGVAAAQLRQWEREGIVTFLARGPRGTKIVLRTNLDSALATLWSSTTADAADFDFD